MCGRFFAATRYSEFHYAAVRSDWEIVVVATTGLTRMVLTYLLQDVETKAVSVSERRERPETTCDDLLPTIYISRDHGEQPQVAAASNRVWKTHIRCSIDLSTSTVIDGTSIRQRR